MLSETRGFSVPTGIEHDSQPGSFYPQLEGLRGALASCVVLHHAMLQVWPNPEFRPRFVAPLSPGRFAVVAFIVLSGFVLGAPVVREGKLADGSARFYARRFRRIVPPYLAALGLSLVLLVTLIGRPTGTHWDLSARWTGLGLVAALTLMNDWFGRSEINHVFWSVAVEAKIYLLFPLLVGAWRRMGLVALVLAVTAAVVATSMALVERLGTMPRLWSDACPWFLILFLLGVGSASVATDPAPICRRMRSLPLGWLAAGAAGLVALGALRFGVRRFYQLAIASDLAVGVVVALTIAALVARPGRIAAFLCSRPLLGLGAISYSLYLIHAPLLQLIQQFLLFPLGLTRLEQFAGLVAVGVPLIIMASWGFFRLCERPFLSRGFREAEVQSLTSVSG